MGNQNVTNMLFYIFILLISAFVIANTTIMVVSRRKKEIGILMAMGAERRSILMIFLLENMLISVPAGVLGCMLGFALARLITLLPLDVTSAGGGEERHPDCRPAGVLCLCHCVRPGAKLDLRTISSLYGGQARSSGGDRK